MEYRTDTLCGMFHDRAERYGHGQTFLKGHFDARGEPLDGWRTLSWGEVREEVTGLGRGLMALGVEPGDRVILMSESRPRWIIADQAIQGCGAVCVPLYPSLSREELVYMVADSGARVAVVSNADKARMISAGRDDMVVVVMGDQEAKSAGCWSFGDMAIRGKTIDLEDFLARVQAVEPGDLASIIYTSGTTGLPKGVMLTQGNWIANVHQSANSDFLQRSRERDLHLEALVFLPLCHVLGQTSDYHVIGLYMGGVLTFVENYNTLSRDLREIRPNVITSIPRLFEKTYDIILSRINRQSWPLRSLFFWAMAQGRHFSDSMATGIRMKPWHLLGFSLANILVFNRVRSIIGMDRLVMAVSGGGKLSEEVCIFFRSMGIQLNEGYGLTETSPVTNYNEPNVLADGRRGPVGRRLYDLLMSWATDVMVEGQAAGRSPYLNPLSAAKLGAAYYGLLYNMRVKPGSVGRTVCWTEEKLAADGEILVKGPQVFSGYWQNPEATAEAFTGDGWFCTGDIGRYDDEGFLYITDRKKELFVTSGGKNIAPHPIEVALITMPYIEQACLVGDNRRYISALIVPDFKELGRWAERQGISFRGNSELVNHAGVRGLIQQQVDAVNDHLARYEQVKYFALLEQPFDTATGELTPTLKVKRRVVYDKFSEQIEGMYSST